MSKKDDIKQAFIDLMIEKGIRNINMNEVFTKAETGSGTFYNYYKSKEDLIEELFFDYISDAIKTVKVDLPKDIEITSIKPVIMKVLDNIVELMSSKNRNLEVLSILGPEFGKKEDFRRTKTEEDLKILHQWANDQWSWMVKIIKKGQELNEIVDLKASILGRMIIGSFSRLFVPQFDVHKSSTKFKNKFKEQVMSEQQIEKIKECVWNMVAIHNKK